MSLTGVRDKSATIRLHDADVDTGSKQIPEIKGLLPGQIAVTLTLQMLIEASLKPALKMAFYSLITTVYTLSSLHEACLKFHTMFQRLVTDMFYNKML